MFNRFLNIYRAKRGGYWVGLIETAFLVGLLVAVLCATFLVAVWVAGGLDTRGNYIDWQMVGSLATFGVLLATIGALAALRVAVGELETQRRNERILHKPYLRVDVGFADAKARHPGFEPPVINRVFTASDFGMDEQLDGLNAFRQGNTDEDTFALLLWVTNQQSTALGMAYNVGVRVVLGGPLPDSSEPLVSPILVEFAYVEPAKTTAIEIARVRGNIDWFVAKVESVSYEDIFTDQILYDRHGAMEMLYLREGGTRNERQYKLGKER